MAGVTHGQENWSGKAAFILAAVGSAVGLGNLVRFPYVAGDTGGGIFVLVYLLCIVFIGLPVLMAELLIGRRGGGSAVSAISRLSRAEGASGGWSIFGWIGIVASFLIVTFYSVLAGWVLHFAMLAGGDVFANVKTAGLSGFSQPLFDDLSQGDISAMLGELRNNPVQMILLNAVFMGATVLILSRGVKGGIEAAAKILMPIFFVLLLVLAVSSLLNGNVAGGLGFMFAPDIAEVGAALSDGSILLQAVGQAFFSLSLGSAMMITYGLYMSRTQDIPSSSRLVAATDTSVALIAGVAIFPIVFAFPLVEANMRENGAGLGILFDTLPLAFHQLPFGALFATAFFLMALFAALTSSIALLEAGVSVVDGDVDTAPEVRQRRRVIGAIVLGLIAFGIGVGHALSQVPTTTVDAQTGLAVVQDNFFNTWHPLNGVPLFEGKTLLDVVDTLASNVLLPIGGLFAAVFAGWVMSSSAAKEELAFKTEAGFKQWRFLVRYICPLFVGAVLVYGAIVSPWLAQQDRGSEAAQAIDEVIDG